MILWAALSLCTPLWAQSKLSLSSHPIYGDWRSTRNRYVLYIFATVCFSNLERHLAKQKCWQIVDLKWWILYRPPYYRGKDRPTGWKRGVIWSWALDIFHAGVFFSTNLQGRMKFILGYWRQWYGLFWLQSWPWRVLVNGSFNGVISKEGILV